MRKGLVLGLALTVAWSLAGSASPGGPVPSVAAFPAEQVTRGEQVWAATCTRCHGPESEDPDAPLLLQAGSLRNYPNAAEVFSYIRAEMPSDEPGTLPEQQYWDVLAYLLVQQGVMAATPLGPDTAGAVPTTP